jgi:hypothetical protein
MLFTPERLHGDSKREREFNALERERLKTDQITEASERLNGAMENVFEYSYANGDLNFQGQPLRPIFDNGIRVAEELARMRPQFMVELQRRYIERQQLDEQIELLRNVDWQDPLVLVHISPTPDAVLKDDVDLNAYDKERKKIMIRITEPTVDGAKVTSMSLDGNDRVALQAVGDFFGVDIPDTASSEDILGMHFLAEKSQFADDRPAKVLRKRYDMAMQMQYGGEWYAGRRDSNVLNTMQKITAYPELVEKHVEEIWEIKQRLGEGFRFTKEYETATYNFLAAIEQSTTTGVAVSDMSSAGEAARASGMEFSKSDCPTGVLQTAEQALSQQGIGEIRHWHYGTCQACLEQTMVGECDVCMSCEAADNRGVDLMEIRRRALARLAIEQEHAKKAATVAESETTEQTRTSGQIARQVQQIFGAAARIRQRVVVGGVETDIVTKSGMILEEAIDLDAYRFAA